MALPLNIAPTYNLVIPSTNKQVNYRPFLIKEEKALLIAQQSEDTKVMMETLKNIISECVKGDIDVNTLATFDLEYIFTQMRSKSVGEIVQLFFKCDTCTDEKAVATVSIDLSKLQVEKADNHTNKIELFNDVGIVLKYPSIDTVLKFENITTDVESIFGIVVDCIEYIYNTEEIYYAKDQTSKDLLEFLNNLTSEQFGKIQSFFETLPKLKKEIQYKCPICDKEHNKVLEGISSFF